MENQNLKPAHPVSFKSKGAWEAIKNHSWSPMHKEWFGDNSGYVICHRNENRELVAVASVIGKPFGKQPETDANAIVIKWSPVLLDIVHRLSLSDCEKQEDIKDLIVYAQGVIKNMSLI
jgi:hypothetical protein